MALNPGDIAFVQYNADGNDNFKFVSLVNIPGGEVILFTDNGWLSTNAFRGGEGVVAWTAPASGVAAGTVVTIDTVPSASIGTVSEVLDLNFAATGDQVIAYQEVGGTITPIAALNNEGSGFQATASDANTSALPQGLVVGQTAITLAEIDNARYIGPTTGDRVTLQAALYNPANWTGDDSINQIFTGTFNITPTGGVTTVTITATDAAAAEAAQDPGTFRITRTGDLTNTLAVSYSVSGQATSGTDYSPSLTGTTTIAAGQSFVDITITPVDDTIVESAETVTLSLVDTASYDLGASTAATVTIADNDVPALPTVTITATDAAAAEAAQDPGTFRITRTGDLTNTLAVSYSVSGQATSGTDYSPSLTGTTTIAAGQSFVDVTITPVDDTIVESAETVTLGLIDTVSYDLGASTAATVTIADNDVPALPTVTITATDAAAAEAAQDPGTFRITRTGDLTNTLAVSYSVSGQATSGTDYSPSLTGTTTIAAGQSFVDVTITPLDDTIVESAETVTLSLVDTASYDLGASTAATVTIADNDVPALPTVTITATDAAAAEAAQDPGTFRITRTGDLTNTLAVSYSVSGQATSGTDYSPSLTGTTTIAAGQSFVDVTITPLDDTIVESAETVTLSLVDTASYDLGASTAATVTIADNDIDDILDTIPPTVDIQNEPTAVMTLDAFDVIFEFDEAVVGFALDDITVGNGSASNFQILDAKTYQASITPNGRGDITIDVAAAVAQDEAGNNNIVATQAIIKLVQQLSNGPILDLTGVTGKVTVDFRITREAEFKNIVRFYEIDDATGSINGIKPGEANYIAAADSRLVSDLQLTGLNDRPVLLSATLVGDKLYAPILFQNGDLTIPFFSFTAANSDGVEHVRSSRPNNFEFEDFVGGGDEDFNDIIVQATLASSNSQPLPGLLDLTGFNNDVLVGIDAILTRDAGFNSTLRFYATDAQGRVNGQLPGSLGYEKAVQANLVTGVGLQGIDGKSIPVSFSLPGGGYYGIAMQINGDPNNLVTLDDAFSGSGAMLRGSNNSLFEFEDSIGSDVDFNDMVLAISSFNSLVG